MLKIIAASTFALGLAGYVSAQTTVNVVGSTAFRTAAVQAEIDLLTHVNPSTGVFQSSGGAPTVAWEGSGSSTAQNATISIVHGFDASGNEIIFRNHWTGSVAGCLDVSSGNTSLTYIPDSTVSFTGSLAIGSSTNLGASGFDTDSGAPNVAMSDCQFLDAAADIVSQGSTGSADATVIKSSTLTEGGTGADATTGVATVNFVWTLGAYTGAAPTNWAQVGSTNVTASGALAYNITQQNAAYLIATGSLPLSSVTGNSSDSVDFLFNIGRNEDSGSRVLYQAESLAAGTTGSTAIGHSTTQWMAKQSGVAYPTGPGGTDATTSNPEYPAIARVSAGITNLQKWPQKQDSTVSSGVQVNWTVSTIPTLAWASTGHSGYNGGGDIAAILGSPVFESDQASPTVVSGAPSGFTQGTSNVYLISCLGASDAATAVGNGAKELSYNGVPYSVANIESGQYTLWNIEHLYYLTSGTGTTAPVSGTAKTAADELADGIYSSTHLGAAGTNLANVTAIRGLAAGSEVH